jgi:hypothetical protein
MPSAQDRLDAERAADAGMPEAMREHTTVSDLQT